MSSLAHCSSNSDTPAEVASKACCNKLTYKLTSDKKYSHAHSLRTVIEQVSLVQDTVNLDPCHIAGCCHEI